ncbi:MAG TPA: C45 family peptidase [Patescibacteria group bacterium]|nr:C45 family peptidase [Patescibacteria group bacterium]
MEQRKRFKLIECSGTDYEIGRQYGEAARGNIVKSINALMGRVKAFHNADKDEILRNTRKYLPGVEQFDHKLIEMLKGQAEGAGVTFDEVFALRCWFELRWYYPKLTTMCTSFAVTGKATKGGEMIVGQNFDVSPGSMLDMVKVKYDDGIEQLNLVYWGGGELIMNSAGVGIVLNVVPTPTEEQRLVVPCCCLMPKAMRQRRVGDTLTLLCTHGRSMLNYTLGSKEGEIFCVETKPDDFNVLQPVNDSLVHTNHYLTERFKAGNSRAPGIIGSSYVRQQRLERLIDRYHGDIDAERMMELMSDHNNYPHSICVHPNEEKPPSARSETVSSVIMVPEEGTMYVTNGPPCVNEYQKFRL